MRLNRHDTWRRLGVGLMLMAAGCSSPLVDTNRTMPAGTPVIVPPASPGAGIAPSQTIMAPAAIPGPETKSVETSRPDGLQHVPLDSVFPNSTAEEVYHEVKSGETLSAIAKRYGTTAAAIEQANGLDSKSILSPGQMIYIPKKPR
jgi:LysM repeat protein